MAVAVDASVAVKVTVADPPMVGVPDTIPLEASIVRPVGSPAADHVVGAVAPIVVMTIVGKGAPSSPCGRSGGPTMVSCDAAERSDAVKIDTSGARVAFPVTVSVTVDGRPVQNGVTGTGWHVASAERMLLPSTESTWVLVAPL